MAMERASGGPAEKAGIEEGNRIAAINSVSLAGDDELAGAMQSRLRRENSARTVREQWEF